MQDNRDGIEFTKRFEQFRSVAYQDTGGVWTIAWGHTRNVKRGDVCDQAQGDAWLAEDRAFAVADVNRVVSVKLTQNEFEALVDFCFNCGTQAFNGSHLLRFVNSSSQSIHFMELAEQEFLKWDHVGGREVAGLLRRRIDEEQLFERV